MIGDENSPEKSSGCLRKVAVFFGLTLLGILVAAVIMAFFPKEYLATATLQAKSDIVFDGGDAKAGTIDLLAQKEMLYPVIENLELEKKWNLTDREKTYLRLRGALKIQNIEDSELFQIGVRDANPQQAAEIANAVAEEYVKRRLADQKVWMEKSQTSLADEIKKLRAKAAWAKDEKERLLTASGFTDALPDSQEPLLRGESSNPGVLKYQEAKDTYLATKKLLEAAEKYELRKPQTPAALRERAEAPDRSRPNLILGLFLGAFTGFVTGCGLAIAIK